MGKSQQAIVAGLVLILSAPAVLAEVVIATSAERPIESLTQAQLADIYLGRQNHLPNGQSVVPIDQTESTEAREAFYGRYLGRSEAQIKAHWSKLVFTGRGRPPRAVEDDGDMAVFLAEHPEAIGYLDRSLVNDKLQVVEIESR